MLTYKEFEALTPSERDGTTFEFGYFLTEDDLLEVRRESFQNGFQEGIKFCIEKLPILRKFSDEKLADILRTIKDKIVI